MAKCDEGYLCCVCGEDVANITVSDLYLRYVTGMISPEVLHTTPERHLTCNPILAQFIVHEDFPRVIVEGEFAKHLLDANFRHQREQLVTRGWVRLQELRTLLKSTEMPITDYPLIEFSQASLDGKIHL